ncbi:MAG: hypothetical protein AAFV88_13315 [Planctomycetota bacterium]
MKREPPPKPLANLQLVELDPKRKVLAGHCSESENVFVVRRDPEGNWQLWRLPVSERGQELRSFMAWDQAEELELVKAIHESITKPKRRRRKAK